MEVLQREEEGAVGQDVQSKAESCGSGAVLCCIPDSHWHLL